MAIFGINNWYLGALGLFVLFLYIQLLGPSNYHRNGLVGRAYFWLNNTLPVLLAQLDARLGCSGLMWAGAEKVGMLRCLEYCFMTRHPILQVLFVVLLACAVFTYLYAVYPLVLAGRYVSQWHAVTSPLAVLMALAAFISACRSDPGRITPTNVGRALRAYPHDYVAFHPSTCTTCLTPRPARSKHCALCNICIARFDHHCVWINNCVGEGNTLHFYAFLASLDLLTLYGAFLMITIGLAIVEEEGYYSMNVVDAGGQRRTLGHSEVMALFLSRHEVVGFLGLFLAMLSFNLLLFIAYHVYLLWRGTTTAESWRWSLIRSNLKTEPIIVPLHLLTPSARKALTQHNAVAQKVHSGQSDSLLAQAESGHMGEDTLVIEHPKQLVNIYNRGLVGNWRDVWLRRSL